MLSKRIVPIVVVLAAGFSSGGWAAASGAAASGASARQAARVSGRAPDGPGAQSYLDVARKDCFGTARNTSSKVWFTVADGVLSDVYSPTIENTNVSTVQYVVSDGRSFADLQQRNMTYSVSSPDRSGMVCRVASVDRRHRFELISTYITDPARAGVVLRTVLEPLRGGVRALRRLKVYVRFDATIDNTGGGGATNEGANNATVDRATTALVASDAHRPTGPFATQVVGALVANRPFLAESSGFAGAPSDGLSQLDRYHRLAHRYRAALDGNVVQTALINAAAGQPFTLALGFAPRAGGAIATARASARAPFARTLAHYERGWRAYDNALVAPPRGLPGYSRAQDLAMQRSYWLSANVLKAAEDKTYLGAFVASPTDPWGQSVPATTTHPGWTYREIFARDSYETFTGLLADGDRKSAVEMVSFLFDRTQQPDGSFPRDSEVNGAVAPDTFGLSEIDEDAYPLLMAWEAGFAGNAAFYEQHVRPAADFIVDHGPAYGDERWEEHPGYSPSTIAAEIAGLVAASQLASAVGDQGHAQLYLATADDYQRNVKQWTVTTSGLYPPYRYFIRLSPNGNPDAPELYNLGNGSLQNVDQRSVIDAGFLELTRLGELPASDPDVQASLGVVDSVLESNTRAGPGWHRYGIKANGSTDGYGDCYEPDPTDCTPTGAPWFPEGVGSGHLWPLLSGERAEQELQAGQLSTAVDLASAMRNMSWGLGYVPEQAWEDPADPRSPYGTDPATASIGFSNGAAAGSAAPLIWGQAQYLRLLRDLQTRKLLDQPSITWARYVQAGAPAAVPVTIASPRPGPGIRADTTTVTGTTQPGAQVVIAAGEPGSPTNDTAVVSTTAASNGNYGATIPTPSGATVITVSASTGPHASGWAQETVDNP